MGFSIPKIISGGLNLLTYGPMENIAALAGTPVFTNLKAKQGEDKKSLQANLLNEKRSWGQLLKDSFSYGDVVSIIGLAGWILSGKFLTGETNEQGQSTLSGVKLWVKRLLQIATIGGFTISRLAQRQNLHIKRALGEKEFRKAFLEAVEQKTGKRVFQELNVDKLIKQASSSILEYNKEQESEVKDLHHSDDFKRFFTGDAGVGKTAGAEEVCGAYAARKRKEGNNNIVIKVLKFENLKDYFSKQSDTMDMASTVAGMFSDEAKSAVESARGAVEVDPFALMELILARVNDEMEEAKKNKQDLILILDEIDSIFQVDKLQAGNYDPAKLRIVFEMLKNLVDPGKTGKILCTSNQDIDFFARLPLDENTKKGLTGEGGRLRVIRRYIERPDAETQARIVAGYVLDKFPNYEQVFDEEILNAVRGKNKKVAKESLAELIHRKVTCNRSLGKLVGRDLNEAVNKVLSNAFAGAKERADEGKDVKLSLDMIARALKVQMDSVSIGSGRGVQADEVAEGLVDSLVDLKNQQFKQLATNYIEKTAELQNASLAKILEKLFDGIYIPNQTSSGNYYLFPTEQDVSKMPVVNGKHYLHCFRLIRPDDELSNLNKWVVETCFRPVTQAELEGGQTVQQLIGGSLYDFERSNPITGEDFYKKLTQKLLFTIDKVSEGGKKQEEGGINLLSLAKSVLGAAQRLGFKGLGLS